MLWLDRETFAIGLILGNLLVAIGASGAATAQEGDPERGEKVFNACKACHKVGEEAKNSVGPVLNGVVDRPAGSFPDYKYGTGLVAAGEAGLVWSPETLSEWLAGPTDFIRSYLGDDAAKAKMTFKLGDEQKRRDVIAYLQTLASVEASAEPAESDITHGTTPFDPAMGAASAPSEEIDGLERVRQELVAPPFAPEHTQKADGEPKLVEIDLSVEEKRWELDNEGTEIVALTFDGSVPGPLIVVHENDYVEVTLKNPDSNLMEHNVDFHAATGALGGAALTTISPGEEAVLRFKATKPGVFLYHCAPEGSMTPYHVTHGMTGAILVLPREGLSDGEGNALSYDRLYYVGENDFYVPRDENGDFKTYEDAGEDLSDWIDVMHTLTPSHVVFNGRVGALTGDCAT